MQNVLRGIVMTVASIALLATSAPPRRAVSPVTTPSRPQFNISQLEFYYASDQVDYIRPGLILKVNSVTVGSDRRPVVDLTFTDAMNQPLDRLGQTTPGPLSIGFISAYYDPATRQYTAFTTRTETAAPPSPTPGVKAVQASVDTGGTWTDLGTGHATYKFGTPLPANDDPTYTHSIGIYATRAINDTINQFQKNYYANVVYDFRPDGGAVTQTWDKMRTASTCNQCHDPLMAHGGSRQDVKLCALCHQPQTVDADTGNTVDAKVMFHKIHRGENLPSVKAGHPYQIIGYRQNVYDFSTVAFPQDVRNCETCHVGNDPKNVGAQSTAYLTAPTRAACGSCHDDINWQTGEGHPAGPMLDDKACAVCHIPDSGHEWDASIKGAHTVPTESKQLAGLKATIVSATNMKAGQKPTVVFKVTNNDGTPVDASKLTSFAPIVGGPTRNYSTAIREAAQGKANTTFDPATGNTTYTFNTALPADANGTWTVSADIYRNATLKRASGGPDISLREAAFNPIQYVAVTDATPQPRRQVVNINQCNQCHNQLAVHGGQRMNTDECVICHNPAANDSARRPADQNPPESVSFQRLIHRIHTGEELTQDFTVYGFGGSRNNFNEVRFPGDRRNCAKCHAGTSYTLPVATSAGPVTTLRDYFSPQGPGTASCLGCHDNRDAAAHAFLNTTNFPGSTTPAEACATCHGTGKDWAVEKVHAR